MPIPFPLQIVEKIKEILHSLPRTWTRVGRILVVGIVLLTMALFSLSVNSQSYTDQLEAAVQSGNWDQAVQLVDQMIQAQPQQREALEAYRSQLLQLRQQDQGTQSGSTQSAPAEAPQVGQIQPVVQPAPSGLQRHRYEDSLGDYLPAITSNPLIGYLRWTNYPVTVYVQSDNETWFDLVSVAIDLWKPYIQLNRVGSPNGADITIMRMPNQGVVAGIAKSTNFYVDQDGTLQHRVEVTIGERPTGGPLQVSAVATHELGHALGLWGHSNSRDDIMFSSLVDLRSDISDRDLNTIKQVYEQPTLIGTQIPQELVDQISFSGDGDEDSELSAA